MSINARLEKLDQRHQELENALSTELKQPSSDDLRITELKRRKLAIKDEIRTLQSRTRH
ncbi:YdcH family protein [Aquisalinus flavus]|uniref:YdcH family protein n=1 Tax=Aquisalinus flavus TaxID=1526572 RepID=UPI00165F4884|nr:DUF465 domain-containing protein [Aquisalinus flavus]MBD0426983.1 DUF465 domain-containing protein [Aquisalinus flavus]UNE46816.1 DUF465 domain-containing protein [Aquisalinus flavus]